MMGPNDENNYVMTMDGQALFDAFCDLAERELQPVWDAIDSCTTLRQQEPEPIEVEVKLPKRWHCNSRKRFVKLLMADGISRNSANELAWLARCFYRSYWDAYLDHKLFGLKK